MFPDYCSNSVALSCPFTALRKSRQRDKFNNYLQPAMPAINKLQLVITELSYLKCSA